MQVAVAQVSTGTGFAVVSGLLVTNHHVIEGCSSIEVKTENGRHKSVVLDADQQSDLALLRVPTLVGLSAKIRSPAVVNLGEPVMVFGFPLAGALTSSGNFTSGLVSGLRGLGEAEGVFQITAPVQLGNSGGPVLDASGQVIGVVTSKLNAVKTAVATGDIPQNINFAVTPEALNDFLIKNKVPVDYFSSKKSLNTASIAKLAQSFTYQIECMGKSQEAKETSKTTPKVSPPREGTTFKDCEECPTMVIIPAGQFVMGASSEEEDRMNKNKFIRGLNRPQRIVNVKQFAIGKFSVTRLQYEKFVKATGQKNLGCDVLRENNVETDHTKDWKNPGFIQEESHPAVCISWDDASEFVQWLSKKSGKNYRLLSEAEWEYAARAATTTYRYWGNDENISCNFENGADKLAKEQISWLFDKEISNCNDGYVFTSPVGSYKPNNYGLHDMLGNSSQWVQDCYHTNYTGAPTDGSAWTTGNCSIRIRRGGSFLQHHQSMRSAVRDFGLTFMRNFTTGFRVARDVDNSSVQNNIGKSETPKTEPPVLKLGNVFKDCDQCPEMVVIPAGNFMMGSPAGINANSEQPQHRVNIQKFAIGKYEVTQEQWIEVMRHNPSHYLGNNRPVESISWEDANNFVTRLAKLTGKNYRLPSESEWEYVASDSNVTKTRDSDYLYQHAWTDTLQTNEVGLKTSNNFGIHDIIGNVNEWTSDCWNENYIGAPTDGSAWTSGDCSLRVYRGLDHMYKTKNKFAITYRLLQRSSFKAMFIGLRVARDLP